MEAYTRDMRAMHLDRNDEAETDRGPSGRSGPAHRPSGEGPAVRARLNGVPCLVQVAANEVNVLTGSVAVAPFSGERAPVPPKGQRATLELVHTGSEPAGDSAGEIEITVSSANRRSGRFSARFLALSEEQARLLGTVTGAGGT